MSDRVLNFSEFYTKYSKEGQVDQASLDNLTGAAANFEEGFDKDTYDQAPLGPKKPVASSTEATPPSPGEVGAPAFNAETEEDMLAPEETAAPAPTETETPTEEPEADSEEPAEEETEEKPAEEETEEEAKEEETPEPEAGANPKKDEKVEEGLVMSFSNFINEEHDDWSDFEEGHDEHEGHEGDDWFEEGHDDDEDLLGANPFKEDDDFGHEEDEYEYEYCDRCGEPIYHTSEGASCGCNM